VLYAQASEQLAALAELVPAPVATTNPGKSAIAESHPLALGASTRSRPKMFTDFMARADLVLAIGTSLTRTPFGPGVPNMVYGFVVFVATMFGAWEGGLIGVATENRKLERFHDDLEAGRFLILIYAHRLLEAAVRAMMAEKHREAEFVAVDRYFLNPFSRIIRPADAGNPKMLQKG